MSFSINQLVRSGVILAIGMPITLAILAQAPEKKVEEVSELEAMKTELGLPCLKFAVSKNDSKVERSAKDAIDGVLGAEGVDYREVCKWALG